MDEIPLHASFELTAVGGASLGPDDVHVWAVPLHGEGEAWAELLSPAERERAARYRFADHQRRYRIAHGALRAVLAGYLGCEPAAVAFTQGPRGKPYLADGRLFFNTSHSGKLALLAVANRELGVDLEKVRHLESLHAIARRHFSSGEFAALEALPEAARVLAFYRCWTRKEAYIKALGEGLAIALDTFDVSVDERPAFLACHDGRERPADWTMLDCSPGPDFVAAAALRHGAPRLRCFRLRGR